VGAHENDLFSLKLLSNVESNTLRMYKYSVSNDLPLKILLSIIPPWPYLGFCFIPKLNIHVYILKVLKFSSFHILVFAGILF
jgi:hypothetical protein